MRIAFDAWTDFVKDYQPGNNLAPASYNAIPKLISGLGLPFQMIVVCRENCMFFCRENENLLQCHFREADIFQMKSGKNRKPYQCLWYLPLVNRLKRL